MYVPFGKIVDDVTFRLSLRHLFCPQLKKKTMEHNPRGPVFLRRSRHESTVLEVDCILLPFDWNILKTITK